MSVLARSGHRGGLPAYVCWHEADMPVAPGDVRVLGVKRSRLVMRISGFDPEDGVIGRQLVDS